MAAVVQGPQPYEDEGTPPEPQDAVIFVGISLVLGIASRHLLRGSRVPYTVALLILGIALGSLGIGEALPVFPWIKSVMMLFLAVSSVMCWMSLWSKPLLVSITDGLLQL